MSLDVDKIESYKMQERIDIMRKNTKKIVTIGISCLVASGLLLGSVEYATHTFAATKVAANAVKTVTESVVENAAQKKAASGVTKEESVYVTLDATGQKKEVIVSDWLKNSGVNGTLKDVSNLTDIQNTKGDEKFTQDGEEVSWEAGENDIYYQGTSDEELPVSMEITYTLDGKEIAPQDLVGKSGKLQIFIQYKNTSVNTVKVGDEEKEVYTPFVMATGMILPVEKFTNVKIDNGQILSEGDNDIVVAYGMPGLKETLDLDSIDFGEDVSIDTDKITDKITDSVTITADVTDFELGPTYTMATSSIFEDIDFDNISDSDDLNDKMDDLKDAASELVDGSDKIQDGLGQLDDKFDEYAKAINKLESSVKKIKNGSSQINSATKKYTKSTDKLLGAVNTYVDGAKEFAKSTKTYSQSTKKLVDGVGALYSATSSFPKSYKEFHASLDAYTTGVNTLLSEDNMKSLTDATSSLKDGVKTVDDGLKSVQSGISTINENASALNEQKDNAEACITGLEAMQKQYTALAQAETDTATKQQYQQLAASAQGAITYIQNAEKLAAAIDASTNGTSDGDADNNGKNDLAAAISQLEAATNTESKEENLYTGLTKLDSSAQAIAKNAKELRNSRTPLMNASKTISSSISEINTNLNTIYKNGKLITANNKKLENAADSLSKNAGKVKKNSKKLTSSSTTFRKATKTLASGTSKLYSGVKTLVTKTGQVSDGIEKLADGAVDLYDGMKQFQKDGTDKLANTMTSLLNGGDDLKDTVEAISNASEEYKSFSGISDDMDGNVKFIMTTEEIKGESE